MYTKDGNLGDLKIMKIYESEVKNINTKSVFDNMSLSERTAYLIEYQY